MSTQLALFADLPPGCRMRQSRARPCAQGFQTPPVQLAFELVQVVQVQEIDPEADPFTDAPIIHRTVSARDAAPLAIAAPCSVFAMGLMPLEIKMQAPGKSAITKVERKEGVIRCVRIVEQDTDEWKEKEARRRAKQIVPRPPKSAGMKSKKLLALIGKG